MINEWDDILLEIERIPGKETANVISEMIDNGYILEVNKFYETFLNLG